jgi:indolepyruvate ferredoxin oxidoreductase beta subunit
MQNSCLLVGVGGQGTVLASKIIAQCAIDKGCFVRTAETIGMAQRGGCVVSHVRYGDNVFSPLIPEGTADLIIAFEPGEAVRNIRFLKKNGTVVVSRKAVKPVTDSLSGGKYSGDEMLQYLKDNVGHLVDIDADGILEKLGNTKVLNLVLLGAAAGSGALNMDRNDLEKAVKERVPEKYLDLNMKAFYLGMNFVTGE